MSRFLVIIFCAGLLISPLPGLAQASITELPSLIILDTCSVQDTSIFDCPGGQLQQGMLSKLTDGLFVILMFLAVIAIVIAGYTFLTAGGDPEKITKSRNFVLYALVGVVVAFMARGLVVLVHWLVAR